MTIKIIDDVEIRLTRKEYDKYFQDYQNSQKYTTFHQSFESYVYDRHVLGKKRQEEFEKAINSTWRPPSGVRG